MFRDGTGELQLAIRNLLNTDPVPVASGPSGQQAVADVQASRTFYDIQGRIFRVIAKFQF